jgi:uncharacterized protein YdaU (DUF1376 family)
MSLRNQPYLPLYVQDFLTDEKLNECSPESTGVYIRLMCIMHKSEQYGKILLKQKDKQTDDQISNFALKLVKHMPFTLLKIESGIRELIEEGVLRLDGDFLIQKRMVKDAEISEKRALSGKKGGDKTTKKYSKSGSDFAQAKSEANTENEIEDENTNRDLIVFEEEVKEEKQNITPSEALPEIPYEEIVKSYNSICKSLPKVQAISRGRKAKIKTRWYELGSIEEFGKIFLKTESTPFLKGDSKDGWKADFDWLIENDTNYNKVLEGKYDKSTSNAKNIQFHGKNSYGEIDLNESRKTQNIPL